MNATTLADVLGAIEKFNKFAPPDRSFMLHGRAKLFGMDIIEAPVRIEQKLKLRQDAPVSDAFRREFDSWLLEMFGTHDVSPVKTGTAYLFGNSVLMRKEDVVRINCCA